MESRKSCRLGKTPNVRTQTEHRSGRYKNKAEREDKSKKELYEDNSDEAIDCDVISECYERNSFILQVQCFKTVKLLYILLIKIVRLYFNIKAVPNEKQITDCMGSDL